MAEKIGFIYKVTNKENGKSYIGQTTQKPACKRWEQHLQDAKRGSKNYFHRALRMYGFKNFDWEIIDVAYTQEELNLKEIYYIDAFDTFGENGYNLTEGGTNCIGKNYKQENTPLMVYTITKGVYKFLGAFRTKTNAIESIKEFGGCITSGTIDFAISQNDGFYNQYFFEYDEGRFIQYTE